MQDSATSRSRAWRAADVIIIVSCRTWELLPDNERWRLTCGKLVTENGKLPDTPRGRGRPGRWCGLSSRAGRHHPLLSTARLGHLAAPGTVRWPTSRSNRPSYNSFTEEAV